MEQQHVYLYPYLLIHIPSVWIPFSDEIGIIPCPEPRYNRSPIVLIETKLGLESWCVKFLLPSLHRKLLLYRQRKNYLDREGKSNSTVISQILGSRFNMAVGLL